MNGVEWVTSTLVLGVAFLVAPAFASFRASRSTQRSELRGYAFALLAILGVGICTVIFDVIHFFDDPPAYRPGVAKFVLDGVLLVPPVVALMLVVPRWRRLPNRPSRRVRAG